MIAWPQIRAVLANGSRMVGPAGQPVGHLIQVVPGTRTSQPTWVSIRCALCGMTDVVVPLGRARLLDGCVQVPYAATDVCAAPRADGSTGRLDRSQEEQLSRYYAVLDAGAPVWPEGLPGQHLSATPARAPAMTAMPPAASNGHRRSAGGPSPAPAAHGILPSVAGLDVRSGDDGDAAYPPAPDGPWPPVVTSSQGPPWWQRRQWRWPSLPTSVRAMRVELRPVLDLTGLPDHELDDLVLAAGEAATNAVEHAGVPTLPFFDVAIEVGERRARIVIQDHGRWRTPSAGGDRGRGLQMIGVLADATLTHGSRGTTVVLRNRPGAAP